MADRIQQGKTGTERLFTVRPRTSPSVTAKRGTVSSIRFHLPTGADKTKWLASVPTHIQAAFEAAVTSEGLGFISFVAQSVSYDIQEKSQTMHTFGGSEAVYFFGRAPINVTFSGLLVDDLDNDQFVKFLNLYYNYLRGSKASQDFCYVTLSINNATFTGAFTGISVQQSSDRDTDINFSAQFLAKTFSLVSTDSFFTENENNSSTVVYVRETDPTITQEAITNTLNANIATNGTNFAGDDATLSVGSYTKSFGALPTISEYLTFDAGDISSFFDDVNSFIDQGTKFIEEAAGVVDSYSNEIVSLIEGVENGIDDVISNVESASNSVFGAIDSIQDAISTVTNFPKSLATKLGSIGGAGGVLVAGSENISPADAIVRLNNKVSVGAARGTPMGDSALSTVNSISKDQTPISSADEIPGLESST